MEECEMRVVATLMQRNQTHPLSLSRISPVLCVNRIEKVFVQCLGFRNHGASVQAKELLASRQGDEQLNIK